MRVPTMIKPWLGILFIATLSCAPLQAGQPQESSSKSKKALVAAERAPSAPKKADNPAPTAASPTEGTADSSYVIGPQDELMISVWREPELSLGVVVRPDGMISMPLLNDVKVVGLKPLELQALLTEKLKGFVNDPQVTVIVKAIRSRTVYVMGHVARQGAHQVNGHKTLLELLADAGGVGIFAKTNSIYISRIVNGQMVRLPFNYKKALKDPRLDIEVLPGDMVVVP